jgi:Ca2+:H+ antiporter
LINATFGNAVEVVVAIQALLANEIRVVQSSMLGSIFSNLLLVLGGCFFFGGLKYPQQYFNATAATANMGLLALSAIALVLPTPFANYYDLGDESVLLISRFAAIFLMFMYLQLLVFQLHTHASVFAVEDGDGEVELANLSFAVSILGLLVTTLLVTIFSEYLVDSIDGFTTASGISRTFVGIILLPIVGNAVEHITAITVARKGNTIFSFECHRQILRECDRLTSSFSGFNQIKWIWQWVLQWVLVPRSLCSSSL